MKETYSRPTITNSDLDSNGHELLPIVGMAVGYAAGRALVNAMKAQPAIKRPALPKARRIADDF